jgi:UDP-3-O-[3-hydroxymyristoyl] glucosamine N-acyltransferase
MDLEFPTTAAALGKIFDASVVGDADALVHSLAPLPKASEGTLSFCANRKYGGVLQSIKGAVLFTRADLVRPELPLTYLVVANPQSAFAEVAKSFAHKSKAHGISPHAVIDPSAILEDGVSVGPFAVIAEGARLGKGTSVGAHGYVGPKVQVGQDCRLLPRVTLLEGSVIGNRVKIFSGTVIGSEGFGFIHEQPGLMEMPQIGLVVIEDDVRIGANCTIDRGTLGETRVGAGTKLDDQVHLGHNVRVGRNCILCGQTGIGGSAVLEDEVVLAGQVGVGDHVTIKARARLAGQAGATHDLPGDQDYFLTPAMPVGRSHRIIAVWRDLPELSKRVRRLEKALATPSETPTSIEESSTS